MDVLAGARAPLRESVHFAAKVVDAADIAWMRDRARLGGDTVLSALQAVLGRSECLEPGDGRAGNTTATAITQGLMAGHGRFTRLEVIDAAGIPLDQGRRLWRALGFAEVGDDQRLFTSADVAALTDVASMITSGIIDIDAAVALARPFGQLLARLAVAQTSFISEVLGQRLGDDHVADDSRHLPEQISAQTVQLTHELLPVLERLTLYVWRRHVATQAGRAVLPPAAELLRGEDSRPVVVGFIDLSGFTHLSRTLPIAALSELLDRFEAQVADTVVAHGGRVIKNVGDEVMFTSDDPAVAAEIALALVEHIAADERLPAAHAGMAYGSVLHRNGDVFGPVVNIASRITGLARSGTIRVDEAMTECLSAVPKFHVSRRATRRVTGYPQLRSYRLLRSGTSAQR